MPATIDQQKVWTTEEEIDFIKSLSPDVRVKYLNGLQYRRSWGKIDYNRIMEAFLK